MVKKEDEIGEKSPISFLYNEGEGGYKTLSENAERNISAMESGFTEKATALEEYQNEISGMQETLRQQADDEKTLINMSVTEAGGYADKAKSSAAGAAGSATEAKNYATGDKNSAKYYYEKTLELFNSLQNVIDSIGYPKGE